MTARWWERAACAGMDTEIFFSIRRKTEAQRVCASCPVRGECLRAAMRVESQAYRHGVWGGMSAYARERLYAATRRKAAA